MMAKKKEKSKVLEDIKSLVPEKTIMKKTYDIAELISNINKLTTERKLIRIKLEELDKKISKERNLLIENLSFEKSYKLLDEAVTIIKKDTGNKTITVINNNRFATTIIPELLKI